MVWLTGYSPTMRRMALMHRITAWLALVGYAIVASGLPLPVGILPPAASDPVAARRLAGKDRSKPFPCMDKACGCATAEQCFKDCCCNTPAELLVWAKANRLDPAVIGVLTRRAAAPTLATAAKQSCCSARAKTDCCEAQQPSCCSAESKPATAGTDSQACRDERALAANPAWPSDDGSSGAEPGRRGGRMVVLRAMLACGGITSQWFASAVSLPPPPVVVVASSGLLADSIALADDDSFLDRDAPEAPPPRVA